MNLQTMSFSPSVKTISLWAKLVNIFLI